MNKLMDFFSNWLVIATVIFGVIAVAALVLTPAIWLLANAHTYVSEFWGGVLFIIWVGFIMSFFYCSIEYLGLTQLQKYAILKYIP